MQYPYRSPMDMTPVEPSAMVLLVDDQAMIGETVRPPCVVSKPKSSPSDRSHKTFPSRFNPIRLPPTPKT